MNFEQAATAARTVLFALSAVAGTSLADDPSAVTNKTQGLLAGEIDAPSERSLSVPLALIGGRNEGC